MAISFEFDEESGRFLTTVTGIVTLSDPVEHLKKVLLHPKAHPGLVALVTCEDVLIAGLGNDTILNLSRFTKSISQDIEKARVAVVTNQALIFGLMRMYEVLRESPFAFKVFFRTPQAAIDWLESADDTQLGAG